MKKIILVLAFSLVSSAGADILDIKAEEFLKSPEKAKQLREKLGEENYFNWVGLPAPALMCVAFNEGFRTWKEVKNSEKFAWYLKELEEIAEIRGASNWFFNFEAMQGKFFSDIKSKGEEQAKSSCNSETLSNFYNMTPRIAFKNFYQEDL